MASVASSGKATVVAGGESLKLRLCLLAQDRQRTEGTSGIIQPAQQQGFHAGGQLRGHVRRDQTRVRIDADVEIARGPCIRDRHDPRRREAVGQIGDFDGTILKCELIGDRNIVDDDVEQAMVPLSRDVEALWRSP